jgi:hypothetical protein
MSGGWPRRGSSVAPAPIACVPAPPTSQRRLHLHGARTPMPPASLPSVQRSHAPRRPRRAHPARPPPYRRDAALALERDQNDARAAHGRVDRQDHAAHAEAVPDAQADVLLALRDGEGAGPLPAGAEGTDLQLARLGEVVPMERASGGVAEAAERARGGARSGGRGRKSAAPVGLWGRLRRSQAVPPGVSAKAEAPLASARRPAARRPRAGRRTSPRAAAAPQSGGSRRTPGSGCRRGRACLAA